MDQHLIKEIQTLKQEVALLKEASMWDTPGPGHKGYVKPDYRSEADKGMARAGAGNPIDPTDIRAILTDLIKRVEALEARSTYSEPGRRQRA